MIPLSHEKLLNTVIKGFLSSCKTECFSTEYLLHWGCFHRLPPGKKVPTSLFLSEDFDPLSGKECVTDSRTNKFLYLKK